MTFKNGRIEELKDEEADILLQMMALGKEKFLFNKAIYSFSAILDIKPIHIASGLYPALPEIKMKPWDKERKLRALKSMREGFLKGVSDANNLTASQTEMLKNMDRLVLRAENIKITQITSPFTAVYGGI